MLAALTGSSAAGRRTRSFSPVRGEPSTRALVPRRVGTVSATLGLQSPPPGRRLRQSDTAGEPGCHSSLGACSEAGAATRRTYARPWRCNAARSAGGAQGPAVPVPSPGTAPSRGPRQAKPLVQPPAEPAQQVSRGHLFRMPPEPTTGKALLNSPLSRTAPAAAVSSPLSRTAPPGLRFTEAVCHGAPLLGGRGTPAAPSMGLHEQQRALPAASRRPGVAAATTIAAVATPQKQAWSSRLSKLSLSPGAPKLGVRAEAGSCCGGKWCTQSEPLSPATPSMAATAPHPWPPLHLEELSEKVMTPARLHGGGANASSNSPGNLLMETPRQAAARRKREVADREMQRLVEATAQHIEAQPIRPRPSRSSSCTPPDAASPEAPRFANAAEAVASAAADAHAARCSLVLLRRRREAMGRARSAPHSRRRGHGSFDSQGDGCGRSVSSAATQLLWGARSEAAGSHSAHAGVRLLMPPAESPQRRSSHVTQEETSSGCTPASPISRRADESPEVTRLLQAPPEAGGGPSPRTGRGLSAARAVASTADPFGTPKAGYRGATAEDLLGSPPKELPGRSVLTPCGRLALSGCDSVGFELGSDSIFLGVT